MTTNNHSRSSKDHEHTRGFHDRKVSKDDIQDLAKLGSGLLKRTVASSLEALKEVSEGLPKEATHLISKGKEEVIKNLLSKEVLQSLMTAGIESFFAKLRQHRLEISIQLRQATPHETARPAAVRKNESKKERES